MRLPKYTGSDIKIMFGILTPYVVLLNTVLFGQYLYSSVAVFFTALGISLSIKLVAWQFHTAVAVYFRRRFPFDAQIPKRIGLALLCFLFMTAGVITFIVYVYQSTQVLPFTFKPVTYRWALFTGAVLNIFATLVHEGASNFEKWKHTLTETEQLKTAYLKSQLEGLRSQIKPHFLFNSINSLSALIAESPERAEVFLDEMCRVYRYLLQNTGGQYTVLGNELAFVRSYFHILKERYTDGIHLEINVDEQSYSKQIPPFTLQTLLENVLQHNIVSRQKPLCIFIGEGNEGVLTVTHTITQKKPHDDDSNEGLHNIVHKFKLLGLQEILVSLSADLRVLQIPLINPIPASS